MHILTNAVGVIAAAALLLACDEPTRDATTTATPAVTATPTRTAEATPTAPATFAPTPIVATVAPGTSPTLPPDTPVSATPGPPLPTATPTVRDPSATPPPLEAGRQRELAPIEALSIRIAESAPPQVFVDVTTGLPGGCARFDSAVVARAGTVITLTMWNTMPTGTVACTAIYGYQRHTVALGAVEPGTYTLRVNDQTRTLVLQ